MKITIVTTSRGAFPQRLTDEESLQLNVMADVLLGHGFIVETLNYYALSEKLLKNYAVVDDEYYYFCSSQIAGYYRYIDNVIHALHRMNAKLVTNYDLFKAHDNKFYQALLAARLGLRQPPTQLIGCSDDLIQLKNQLEFPLVLKSPGGSGSTTVSLAKNFDHLMSAYKKIADPIIPLRKNLYQYWKTFGRYSQVYADYVGPVVLQGLIKDCDHDWKVLVFGDKLYTLKRSNREGDFRASGSGRFSFDAKCDSCVLDFALAVCKTLDTPIISLDIIVKDKVPYLVEFQAIHFGPYTLTGSNGYYCQLADGKWGYIEEKSQLEPVMADAIAEWIKAK